jgi:ABC-type nitrate/sulfonate/bicarbonate transport system substrate-binding protein
LKLHILAADQGAVRLAEANDYVARYQTTAIMARRRWAQENSEVVVHFLRGMIRAMRWIYGNRNDFLEYAVKKLKIKEEYAAAGWDSYAGKR